MKSSIYEPPDFFFLETLYHRHEILLETEGLGKIPHENIRLDFYFDSGRHNLVEKNSLGLGQIRKVNLTAAQKGQVGLDFGKLVVTQIFCGMDGNVYVVFCMERPLGDRAEKEHRVHIAFFVRNIP